MTRSAWRGRRCIARWPGSDWRPSLPGDVVMARCPEDDVARPKAEYLLWPPIRDQIFYADAVTHGGQRVDFGDNAYAPVDMDIGPEDPRPFVELAATLGQDRIPWRCVDRRSRAAAQSAMQLKDIGASFLSMFPGNADLRRALAFLNDRRVQRTTTSASGCARASRPGRRSRRQRSCAAGSPHCHSASRAGATRKRPRSSAIRWRAS